MIQLGKGVTVICFGAQLLMMGCAQPIDDCTVQTLELQNENNNLQIQVSSLLEASTTLQEVQDENSGLNQQLFQLRNENYDLQTQVSSLLEASTTLQEVQDENSGLKQQLVQLRGEIIYLHAQLNELRAVGV